MSRPNESPLFRHGPHESGERHASGAAIYVDDLPHPAGMLVAEVVVSGIARGKIRRLSLDRARHTQGVQAVLTAADIPGINDISPFSHDEPLLAAGEVFCVGQAVALVVAGDLKTCRQAKAAIEVDIDPLPPILDLRSGIAAGSFLTAPHQITRGDVEGALASSALVLEGEVESGGQDHFYLETQAALAVPQEVGLHIYSSTQHPSEVQAKVAEVLHLSRHQVVVETARMGGGFGGKETQAAHFAALAALGAQATGRPVKLWLNRDQDMTQTGKRHPWYSRYRAGFDAFGGLLALSVETFSDGGWSADLSQAILDRCLFHLDNGYYIPNLRFVGRVVRTNNPSNTAFRGFGGPQGMVVIETILSRAAERLMLDPAEVRRRNFYGPAPRDRTPYDQCVPDCRLPRILDELLVSSDYARRRQAIADRNQRSPWIKRGLAFSPVKFGISFTNAMLNQAGALLLIYADGTVQLNHGGTEMGQGLHTKMLAICAHELGVPPDRIRLMHTATDKVPNTSATAASSGSDLNGQAVKQACEILRARLLPVAAALLGLESTSAEGAALRFFGGVVTTADGQRSVPFGSVVLSAYQQQVSLSATGFYRTPNISYDRSIGRGKPFHYFAYGGAVTELEVNGLTGEHRLLRVDILHDCGESLVPSIDLGQIEGGFVQGLGWLLREELVFDAEGRLLTHSPDTYKIPTVGDVPEDFRVGLLSRAEQPEVIHGSKAVGEPPLMLAISAVLALREAIRAFSVDERREVELSIPCTPESVLFAVEKMRAPVAKTEVEAKEKPAGVTG